MEDNNDFATLVIQHHVKPAAKDQYESWVKKIAQEGQRFKGHLGVNGFCRKKGVRFSEAVKLAAAQKARE